MYLMITLLAGQATAEPIASSMVLISAFGLHKYAPGLFTTSTHTRIAWGPRRRWCTVHSGSLEDQRPSAIISPLPLQSSKLQALFWGVKLALTLWKITVYQLQLLTSKLQFLYTYSIDYTREKYAQVSPV